MAEDKRPTPAFGEYAPEGWEWKPEEAAEQSETPQGGAPGSGQEPRPGAIPAPASHRQGSGQVPGVPHNLGAGGQTPQPQAPSASPAAPIPPASNATGNNTGKPGEPAPFRADAPNQLTPGAGGSAQKAPGRKGDKIITILLLVLGGLGALNMAGSLLQLPGTVSMMAEAFELTDFVVPSSLSTIGTAGALLVFGVYALNLIYSIQRIRAGKLAFWVPLAAAVIAFLFTLAFTMIGLYQSPELVNTMADPTSVSKLLDYLQSSGMTP